MVFGLFEGGGSSTPPPDNSMNYPGKQEAINAARDAATEKQQRIDLYNQRLAAAMGNPMLGNSYASSIGLDPNNAKIQGILSQIMGTIGTSVPRDQDTTVNPESYFSPDAFGSQLSDYEQRGRRANVSQVRNAFAPGYESTLLPDSSIDDIVGQILGEQRGLADTKVGYQSKRGLLTPQGLEQANKSLTGQGAAAESTLRGVGRGVLNKDRSSINDIIGEAGNAASSWMLGNDDFSVDPYRARVSETAGRERGQLGGDVRAALGNTELFDIPSIVAQAGTAQGSDNLNLGGKPGLTPGSTKKKTASRGLGSSGGGF